MTLDSIIEIAFGHLQQKHFTGEELRKLIKDHAMEELDLSERDAETFARKEEPDLQDQIDATAFQEFYLWYYFNHIAPPEIEHSHNLPVGTDAVEIKGHHDLILYAVIKVTAKVDSWPPDDAIDKWASNCYYELASSNQLKVIQTEFVGTTTQVPRI